jgi:cytochrome bd ubiquinol oxidase subunit I
MGMSLGFHMIFAVIGMALPMMMSIAEWRWRTTADPAYLLLYRSA